MILPKSGRTPWLESTTWIADEFASGPSYCVWRDEGTEDWLLIHTVAGRGFAGCGGEMTPQVRGSTVLYAPGTPHHYGTDPEKGAWRILWCHFRIQRDWGMLLDWPEIGQGLRQLHVKNAGLQHHVRTSLRTLVEDLGRRIGSTQELAANSLERSLLLLHGSPHSGALDERVWKAARILAAGISEPVGMAELARRTGLSDSRLAHLFSEQFGMPPRRYHLQLRLQHAARLLATSAIPVKEVSERCGFASPFYFSTRFSRFFGKSPVAYRRGSGSA